MNPRTRATLRLAALVFIVAVGAMLIIAVLSSCAAPEGEGHRNTTLPPLPACFFLCFASITSGITTSTTTPAPVPPPGH